MSKFNNLFDPPLNNQLELVNIALDVLKSQIGRCIACKYYRPTTMPGCVTDYGECLLRHPNFTNMVLSSDQACNSYQQDAIKFEYALNLKAKLEREINDK